MRIMLVVRSDASGVVERHAGERADLHWLTGRARLNDLAAADVHGDVTHGRVEEDEVSGLQVGLGDGHPDRALVTAGAGELDACLGEGPLHETAAVERVRSAGAPSVRGAELAERDVHRVHTSSSLAARDNTNRSHGGRLGARRRSSRCRLSLGSSRGLRCSSGLSLCRSDGRGGLSLDQCDRLRHRRERRRREGCGSLCDLRTMADVESHDGSLRRGRGQRQRCAGRGDAEHRQSVASDHSGGYPEYSDYSQRQDGDDTFARRHGIPPQLCPESLHWTQDES